MSLTKISTFTVLATYYFYAQEKRHSDGYGAENALETLRSSQDVSPLQDSARSSRRDDPERAMYGCESEYRDERHPLSQIQNGERLPSRFRRRTRQRHSFLRAL